MFLRLLCAAAIAMLLGGCTGWWSETRLIPVTARDTAGLEGTFILGEGRRILSPTAQGLVRAVDPASKEPPNEVALAFLREEAPKPSTAIEAEPEEGELPRVVVPDRSYLMEVGVADDDGKTAFIYAIARIGFAEDGSADQMELFSLLCSNTSEKFAARKEEQVCIFDDYARLRAAALDALTWYDDARMVIDKETWRREIEADEMAADEP